MVHLDCSVFVGKERNNALFFIDCGLPILGFSSIGPDCQGVQRCP